MDDGALDGNPNPPQQDDSGSSPAELGLVRSSGNDPGDELDAWLTDNARTDPWRWSAVPARTAAEARENTAAAAVSAADHSRPRGIADVMSLADVFTLFYHRTRIRSQRLEEHFFNARLWVPRSARTVRPILRRDRPLSLIRSPGRGGSPSIRFALSPAAAAREAELYATPSNRRMRDERRSARAARAAAENERRAKRALPLPDGLSENGDRGATAGEADGYETDAAVAATVVVGSGRKRRKKGKHKGRSRRWGSRSPLPSATSSSSSSSSTPSSSSSSLLGVFSSSSSSSAAA